MCPVPHCPTTCLPATHLHGSPCNRPHGALPQGGEGGPRQLARDGQLYGEMEGGRGEGPRLHCTAHTGLTTYKKTPMPAHLQDINISPLSISHCCPAAWELWRAGVMGRNLFLSSGVGTGDGRMTRYGRTDGRRVGADGGRLGDGRWGGGGRGRGKTARTLPPFRFFLLLPSLPLLPPLHLPPAWHPPLPPIQSPPSPKWHRLINET